MQANRDKPRVLDCKHVVDEACLHDYVVELVGRKNAVGLKCPVVDPASGKKCATEVNVGHIQAVLTAEEFSSYLEVRCDRDSMAPSLLANDCSGSCIRLPYWLSSNKTR